MSDCENIVESENIDEEIVTELLQGERGAPGINAIGATYTHLQPLPSATWSVVHNLNTFPSVTVLDSANEVILGDVRYVDANNIQLIFTAAFSGVAYLN